jgi:hypothetical protein
MSAKKTSSSVDLFSDHAMQHECSKILTTREIFQGIQKPSILSPSFSASADLGFGLLLFWSLVFSLYWGVAHEEETPGGEAKKSAAVGASTASGRGLQPALHLCIAGDIQYLLGTSGSAVTKKEIIFICISKNRVRSILRQLLKL